MPTAVRGALALIYVDEGRPARNACSFDEMSAIVLPLRQCPAGRRPETRRTGSRLFLSQSVETADRASGGRFRSGLVFGAAVHAVRRGCAGSFVSPIPGRRRAIVNRRERMGEARKNPRASALPAGHLCHPRAAGSCRRQAVLGPSIEAALGTNFATLDTGGGRSPPSSSTPRAPPATRKGRAARPPRAARPSAECRDWAHDFFFPKPGRSDVDLPADWAWIGGAVRCAVCPGLVSRRGNSGPHRARKFEPRAAMQLMADHGVRNVFPAARPAPEADAAGRLSGPLAGLKLRQHLHRRRVARRRTARLGAARPSASTRHEIYGQTECNLGGRQ